MPITGWLGYDDESRWRGGPVNIQKQRSRLLAPSPLEVEESLWSPGTKGISKEVAEGAHCRGKRPFSVR